MAVLKTLPLSDIHVGDRARPVDEDHAQAIAASMAERGLINPITVRATPARKGTPYTLVAGGHRRRAAEINGWTQIDVLVATADAAEAQLLEISENLYRNDLSKLDRAVFVLKFREVWEEKNGKIDARKNLKVGTKSPKDTECPSVFAGGRELSKQVQERLGFGSTTYKKVSRIGRNLHPDLRHMLRGTPVADDQTMLLKLSRLPLDDQMRIAAALRQEPDLKKVLALAKPPAVPLDAAVVQDGLLAKMLKLWEQADGNTRQQFLDAIGDMDDCSHLKAAQ